MTPTLRQARPAIEPLESRLQLTSSSILYVQDFNTSVVWPQVPAGATTGVTATVAQTVTGTTGTGTGTVDTEFTSTKTGAVGMTVTAVPSGYWRAEMGSGQLTIPNSGMAKLGLLTLSFDMNVSQAKRVKVHVYSYSTAGVVTGGLETEIDPALAGSFQRYALDLSTMKASGPGTFSLTTTKISFNFEVSSYNGWTTASSCKVLVDNVNYSKPAYYVSPTGSDSNNGLTELTPFRTPQEALVESSNGVVRTQPGDIVVLRDGSALYDYTQRSTNTGALDIKKGGTPAAWVTIKSYPGESPIIYNEAWNAINIGASSTTTNAALAYIEVRGLHVVGDSPLVGPRTAPDGAYDSTQPAGTYGIYGQYIGLVDPHSNGNGISIDGRKETNKPHDIRFADNLVEDCPGAGFGAGDCDRVQIENNIARNNCYWNIYACSGFSVLSTYNFESTATSTNYYTRVVRNNIASGNIGKEKWASQTPPVYSDGNGIIIDINWQSADSTKTPPQLAAAANGRTLVQDNLSFDNGGSGIHAYHSNYVDIVHNTAYLNSASTHLQYGQIFANSVTDARITNNIMVAPVANTAAGEAAEAVNGGTKPSSANSIYYKNNIYFGGNSTALKLTSNPNTYGAYWPNDGTYNIGNIAADPKFANATVNAALADFRLQSTSPAIDAGDATFSTPLDLLGNVRHGTLSSTIVPDIGAYEYYVAAPSIVATAASPATVAASTSTVTVVAGDNNDPRLLTYTWAITTKPTGATDPTFSDNATTTAKVALATFSKAGAYTLRVTVSDGTNSTTSSVNVTVNQTLSGLTVTPSGAIVGTGKTQSYSVAGIDQFGQSMPSGTVVWTTSGTANSINSASGVFSASATVTGAFTVTATGGGFSATVNGTVADQTGPSLTAVGSSKVHGSSGTFVLPLAAGGVTKTIEPRVGGASTLVFTFSEAIKAVDGLFSANEFSITNATFGSATISGSTLTLNLTNVINGKYSAITASGISDLVGNVLVGTATLSVGNLYGDVNQTGTVTVGDVQVAKNNLSVAVSVTNFLSDVNASGGTVSTMDQQAIKDNLLNTMS